MRSTPQTVYRVTGYRVNPDLGYIFLGMGTNRGNDKWGNGYPINALWLWFVVYVLYAYGHFFQRD